MKRAKAIRCLAENADAMKGMGATALYLFGSTAKGTASETSDLDLFIDHEPQLSLLDLVEIKQFLESVIASDIDVTTRGSLHPMLRAEIEQSAIRIF